MTKGKVVTVRLPEALEKEIEDLMAKGYFKSKSEFVRFSLIKTLLEFKKFDKDLFDYVLREFSERFKDVDKEGLVEEAIEWARR